MSCEFKLLRRGIIDTIVAEQDITNLDLWSDLRIWIPITPFYACTYILKITDDLFIKIDQDRTYYLIAEFCKHDQMFVIMDWSNRDYDRKISDPMKTRRVQWKLIE